MEVNKHQVWALVRQLWQVAQHVRRGQQSNPQNHLTVQLLALAAERGPLRPHEVSELLEVTAPSATRYVQALEQAGQINVIADVADGRTYLIEINDAGREVLQNLQDELLETMRQLLDGWKGEDVSTLLDLLGRLTKTMNEKSKDRPVRKARKNRWRDTA